MLKYKLYRWIRILRGSRSFTMTDEKGRVTYALAWGSEIEVVAERFLEMGMTEEWAPTNGLLLMDIYSTPHEYPYGPVDGPEFDEIRTTKGIPMREESPIKLHRVQFIVDRSKLADPELMNKVSEMLAPLISTLEENKSLQFIVHESPDLFIQNKFYLIIEPG